MADDKLKERLQTQLKALESLVPIVELPGFPVIEQYAEGQLDACQKAVYNEREADPTANLVNCSYIRGQGDVWMSLSKMRSTVASRIADVRRQLAALRKEA